MYNFVAPQGHVTDTPSGHGYALSFDGVDDYVNVGNFGSFYSKGTIEFWMYPSVVENYRNPFHTHFNGVNVGIRFEESSAPYFGVNIGNDSGVSAGHLYIDSGFVAGKWYHVILTWDTTTNMVTGYLDGTQKFNAAHTLWPTTLPSITIGRGFSIDRSWNGFIDEVRIYDNALSAYQIQSHYYVGLNKLLAKGLIENKEYQKRTILK
jgi:hypothetical protein